MRKMVAALVLTLAACSAAGDSDPAPGSASTPTPSVATRSASPDPGPSPTAAVPTPTQTAAPSTPPRPQPARFDASRTRRDVARLSGGIGPREATSAGYRRAAAFVADRFNRLGYDVRRARVRVPAGDSWGTRVRAGTSLTIVAEPPGFDPRRPHRVVGAHLDTIAGSPGAEDNASGVAVLLELARLAAAAPPDIPVQFIAFAAEEPRGPGDAWHHFGSQQWVADLSRTQRRAVRGMVSLDRVGVRAAYVPVCTASAAGRDLQAAVRRVGRRLDITTRRCDNRSSDHWSYVKAGIDGVRVGSIPYAGYHSPRDTLRWVDRRQLDRVGRLVWGWLQT